MSLLTNMAFFLHQKPNVIFVTIRTRGDSTFPYYKEDLIHMGYFDISLNKPTSDYYGIWHLELKARKLKYA